MADDTAGAETSNSRFRAMTEAECLRLLSSTTVGRVAFVDHDGIQLVPLNFAFIDDALYFRTDPGSVLHALAEGHDAVAFEIDHHAEASPIGWNVTVKGSTSRVTDPTVYAQVMAAPRLRPWVGGDRAEVVRLNRTSIDGRRVRGG